MSKLERLLLMSLLGFALLQLLSFYNIHHATNVRVGDDMQITSKNSYKNDNNRSLMDYSPSRQESASACLLIMDDNHYLIEWIAYHYHVLNLRHLIVATDPKSKTSPSRILNRWRNYIQIEEWTDDNFWPSNTTKKLRKYGGASGELRKHRARQGLFTLQCLRHFKRKDKSWVLLTDTDEYTTINPKFTPSVLPQQQQRPTIEQPGSVLTFLNEMLLPDKKVKEIDYPCVYMYRHQFSNKESPRDKVQDGVPSSQLNPFHFQTLRWRYCDWIDLWHNATIAHCKVTRKLPGKTMIDLKRLRLLDLYHPANAGNPHFPLEGLCQSTWPKLATSPLAVHHYIGTLEQWLYRTGDTRGNAYRMALYDHTNDFTGKSENDNVRLWLKGFVDNVGQAEAVRLLQGVGQLEPLPQQQKLVEISNQTSSNTTQDVYKVGERVQGNYKGDGYWFWVDILRVYPGGYYNILYDDCSQELGVPASMLRRTGKVDELER